MWFLAAEASLMVMSVGYRPATEYPHPAAVDDCSAIPTSIALSPLDIPEGTVRSVHNGRILWLWRNMLVGS
ncbi:hypothetical protein D5S17_05750 [Pseudonocardiaceae bacterium YIM PH 21723]|nr:hypothetical protein D5S17_05750 [Pseudonocardiaceae bacterium YIM PH 21723]